MMDFPIGETCTRGIAAGSICPRPAEVRVHLVDTATGETNARETACPVHAFELAARAFRDASYPEREPCTIILAPLLE